MNQQERLTALVRGLAAEHPGIQIPCGFPAQRRLLRALMNVRPPAPLNPAWLRMQDEFLQEEMRERGVVEAETLPPVPCDARLSLWRGDITRLRADAIVNAANSALLGCFCPNHGCIDNAIHSAAGLQLREACAARMRAQGHAEPAGRAKLTPGFNLPARYVLHTVGPIVSGALTPVHCETLASCYRACLEAAAAADCRTLAFCCISTGEYRFPPQRAAEIAIQTVRAALPDYPGIKKVIFNVYKESDFIIYHTLLGR